MSYMLFGCSAWRVASVFFREPGKSFSLAEISRRAGIAHTSVTNHLKRLTENELVVVEKTFAGSREYPVYKASQNEQFREQKKLFNLSSLQPLIEHLETQLAPRCIVLYGSYAQGEDTEHSDIDLFMECKEQAIDISAYESELARKIHLLCKRKFGQLPEELKNNIINGAVLQGYLEAY